MTDYDLKAIEHRRAQWLVEFSDEARDTLIKGDVPALVAEVRRLRDLVTDATAALREARDEAARRAVPVVEYIGFERPEDKDPSE